MNNMIIAHVQIAATLDIHMGIYSDLEQAKQAMARFLRQHDDREIQECLIHLAAATDEHVIEAVKFYGTANVCFAIAKLDGNLIIARPE
jgi:hypothetical protein